MVCPCIGASGKCSAHIWNIVVTLDVSHFEMFWLKLVAMLNLPGCVSARPHIGTTGKCSTHISSMLVTLEVSHTEMSWLKLVAD